MSKESEKLVAQLNDQTEVIEKMREGLERICELDDNDSEVSEAKDIAKQLLASFDFIEGEEGEDDEDEEGTAA